MTPKAPDLRAALGSLPHFRELPAPLIERLVPMVRVMPLPPGRLLFREGQPCDGFYAVLEGAVAIFRHAPDGREQVVHHVGPGRSFAEAALFRFGTFPASARAAAPSTRVLRVDGPAFLRLFAEERALATGMVGGLCQWLHVLLDRIDILTRASAGARLAAWLLEQPASGRSGRLVVELRLPKKALAAELSLTPETLSRLLRRWSDAGWIEVAGRRLLLLDVDALTVVAEGGAPRSRRAGRTADDA